MHIYIIGALLLAIYSSMSVAQPTTSASDSTLPSVETVATEMDLSKKTSESPTPEESTVTESASSTTETKQEQTTSTLEESTAAEPASSTTEAKQEQTDSTKPPSKETGEKTSNSTTTEPVLTSDEVPVKSTPSVKENTKGESTQTTETVDAKTTSPVEIPTAITKALKRIIKVDFDQVSISETAVTGLYEVVIGAEVLYVSADGRYLVMGDIRDIKTGQNLTDDKRAQLRIKELNALDEKEMIVFAPEQETKYTINVFTDVDCPYCAKFHNEVPKLNEGGVKVRYLAFPRAGAGSKTYKTMVSVWCAKDRQQAITDAKARRKVEETTCNNPVDKQYELGKRIGVSGTPAMVLSNGELVPGYVPADRLILFLEQKLK